MHDPGMWTAEQVLARTLWGEARGEGRSGMEAVAAVVRNRAVHPRWWGRDVRSVCLAPRQFSCWDSGDPNRVKLLAVTEADPAFATALTVARAALAGELPDLTEGADSYVAVGCRPDWLAGAALTCRIGRLAFYRVELPPPAKAQTPCEKVSDEGADALNAAELEALGGGTRERNRGARPTVEASGAITGAGRMSVDPGAVKVGHCYEGGGERRRVTAIADRRVRFEAWRGEAVAAMPSGSETWLPVEDFARGMEREIPCPDPRPGTPSQAEG